ncbi:putative membrane protein [Ruminiclostridium sufflavum DSM 19573]|uniref:Putative membrane protein n=1 Tax=Ruminiclostridium sufflavum DSM 19573 TaxID=1121337 RepID=A0A318Y212_9FIRM|nr:6-pyruvoyl-tetrahydropterin synthase-related protein [Ruminiclostridium sufflavum]PYG85028.1 putative membrane protein [Ruminiclostridium sufflavum DSM 19573]
MKEIASQKKQPVSKNSLETELKLAVIIALLCSLAGSANLLFESNALFPASDAMGCLTRVKYIADCLSQGKLPSWFPFWYNGCAAAQYYMPLSYCILVPIYLLTGNIMFTYKIYCIGMMFTGGMGVWVFCRRKIGNWCGLIGIVSFCLQSFLLESLYSEGFLTQAPVFAIMPWFLLALLSCAEKPSRINFTASTVLAVLMTMSHALQAILILICTIILLLLLAVMKKLTFTHFITSFFSAAFSIFLTACLAFINAAHSGNSGTPALSSEFPLKFTAGVSWFTINESAVIKYSFTVGILSALAIIIFVISGCRKRNNLKQSYYFFSVIALTIITCLFPFGVRLPLFKYLPLSGSIAPGRILSYTSVTGAILSAYVIAELLQYQLKSNATLISKITYVSSRICVFLISAALIISMNPYKYAYPVKASDSFNSTAEYLDTEKTAFNKGRYCWLGSADSLEAYFPLQYETNICNGWNLESFPYNQAIWNYDTALSSGSYSYIAKQLAFHNVRYLLLGQDYSGTYSSKNMVNILQTNGFEKTSVNRNGYNLYTSKKTSSYFMTDSRNAIIIGDKANLFTMSFPYLIQGKSADITDYTFEELSQYKLVYLYQNDIDTEKKLDCLEALVTQLVNKGIHIIIEPEPTGNFDIFGVSASDEILPDNSKLELKENCPWKINNKISLYNNEQIRAVKNLHNLDDIFAAYSNGAVQNSAIGVKKVGNGNVIFIGGGLSQYLLPFYINAWGVNAVDDNVKSTSKDVLSLYEKIFDTMFVSKSFIPEQFNVTASTWNYKGGRFSYTSNADCKVTISVSYAPEWSATADGSQIKISQCEDLITLDLPAGKHTVNLNYSIAMHNKSIFGFSFLAFILLILIIVFFYGIQEQINGFGKFLKNYLQY